MRQRWDMLVAIPVLYIIVVLPLRLGYPEDMGEEGSTGYIIFQARFILDTLYRLIFQARRDLVADL